MTETTTAIALPDQAAIVAAFDSDEAIASIVKRIEDDVLSEHLSVATPKDRDRIKSLAYSIARSKTTLDDIGKAKAEDAKRIVTTIDGRRKLARDRLDALKDKVRAPLDAWEKAETERKIRIKTKIADLFSPKAMPFRSDDLKSLRASIEAVELDQFEEFSAEAAKAKDHFLQYLAGKIRDTELEEEAAERRRLERIREQEEAAEAKRRAEEAEAIAARERAENERLRAELEAMKQTTLPVEQIDTAPVVVAFDPVVATVSPAPSVMRPLLEPVAVRHSPQAREEARRAISRVLNQCHTIDAMAQEVAEAIWNGEIPNVAPTISVEGEVS